MKASLFLGCVGFGGGLSVLANIQSLVVARRRWLTEREFSNAVTVSQMLPGGAAANALAYIGLRFGGITGALAGYVGFVLPGFVAVMALAWTYLRFGTTPDVESVLGGFNASVVGIIAAISLKMLRTSVSRPWQMVVAALALLFSAAGNAPPGEVALISIAVGIAVDLGSKRVRLRSFRRVSVEPPVTLPEEGQLLTSAAVGAPLPDPKERPDQAPQEGQPMRSPLLAGLCAMTAAFALQISGRGAELVRIALVFFRTGLGAYGGGFAIVPHLRQVMLSHQWLTDKQFAAAVAIGKLTPGPVLLLASFIGYVRGGVLGGVVATIAIFAAPFGLVVLAGSWLDRLRSRRPVRAGLRGLTPAVLGLMVAACLSLGGSLAGEAEIGIAAAVAMTLLRFEVNPALMLAIGGVARIVLKKAIGL